ncbi:MAG: hypothetical protein R3C26_10360 [Calditrichia bacterium]
MLAVANFEQDNSQFATVVINEVDYNSAAPFDSEDWWNFTTTASEPVDMAGISAMKAPTITISRMDLCCNPIRLR